MNSRTFLCILALGALAAGAGAQTPYSIEKPQVWAPLRPYMAPAVPPVSLANSSRLNTLIRAGKLYLTVEDALALAIENNLNLQIARYGPMLADSALERARAGGPIRGVPSASAQVSSVNSGVGVAGSTASAGLGGGGGSGGGGGGGNATIQQVGAITPNLDPTVQSTATFSHLTQPQANTILSRTNALVQSIQTSNTVLQQGLLTGGNFQYRNYQQRLYENAPSDLLNPAVGPHMDLVLRQNFLQGYGVALNNRGIRIAGINITAARESFRSQLMDLAVAVLNLYWDYAGAANELEVRRRAVEVTQRFRDDTKYEISVGALAGVELPRAEAELARRRQDLAIAEATLRQRATQLKEALSHTEDPALEAADIICLDRIEVPETEELPPLRDLVTRAMSKRPDVAVARSRAETDEMALPGTTNPLLPSLQVVLQTYNRGVAGTPQASGGTPNPYFVGGYGTALGQIFRRNFPNNYAQATFEANFHNRQAQGDYGIDQLQFRQSRLRDQKDRNQILVDISSQANALRQARSRYSAARDTRALQEQLLAAERKRSYGTLTFNYIMVDQRALIAAQLSEMQATAAYARARVSLDQVLGETLERHHITLEEGLGGRVTRESAPAAIGSGTGAAGK
jgi:outer membrane protein